MGLEFELDLFLKGDFVLHSFGSPPRLHNNVDVVQAESDEQGNTSDQLPIAKIRDYIVWQNLDE